MYPRHTQSDDTTSIATTNLYRAANFDRYDDDDTSSDESSYTSRSMVTSELMEDDYEFMEATHPELNPFARPFLTDKMRVIQRFRRGMSQYELQRRLDTWSRFIDENPYTFFSWTKHIHPWFVIGGGSRMITRSMNGYLFLNGRQVTPKAIRKLFRKLFPETREMRIFRHPGIISCIILRTSPLSQVPLIDYDAFNLFYSLPLPCQCQIRSELANSGNTWFDAHVV